MCRRSSVEVEYTPSGSSVQLHRQSAALIDGKRTSALSWIDRTTRHSCRVSTQGVPVSSSPPRLLCRASRFARWIQRPPQPPAGAI
jgi:hypothetical protein